MGANVVISTITGTNKNTVNSTKSSNLKGFLIGCSLTPYMGVKDSVPDERRMQLGGVEPLGLYKGQSYDGRPAT